MNEPSAPENAGPVPKVLGARATTHAADEWETLKTVTGASSSRALIFEKVLAS